METATAKWAGQVASLVRWLMGPIFDKEMRVSSRHRRNYVLRVAYIGFFTLVLTLLWFAVAAATATPGSSSVYQASRMASVGQAIVIAVLWFQFLAAQAIAIVMLSTSISDEIYKRTLGTLLTTPIRSFQIVMGKLASKLLQIVLLLAISLPLLAIVRVFGGVPWSCLLAGLGVTMTAVVFVGSLSLFFSIFTRRAYVAIIEAVLVVGLLFLLIPGIVEALYAAPIPAGPVQAVLMYPNPYATMGVVTLSLYMAGPPIRVSWPLHCAIMLGASSFLLLLAMLFVRRAALRQAAGQATARGRRRGPLSFVFGRRSLRIRRVKGAPVLWKERMIPLFGRHGHVQNVVVALGLILLAATYGLSAEENVLMDPETHVEYAVLFVGIGLFFATVLPATCITTERESQTWPLLLTTTLGTWQILWGKAMGAMWRCTPVWLLLFGHLLVFIVAGIIHPIALVQVGGLAVWILLFLTSTGLYFSGRLRHTTTAVIANLALAVALWVLAPLFLQITLELAGTGHRAERIYTDLNPFIQVGVIMNAAVHTPAVGGHLLGRPGSYDWAQGSMKSLAAATGWMALTFAVYALLGLVFLMRTAARLRRNPF